DLKVTVTDGKTAAVPGTKDTYTIVVTNVGPSNIAGASSTTVSRALSAESRTPPARSAVPQVSTRAAAAIFTTTSPCQLAARSLTRPSARSAHQPPALSLIPQLSAHPAELPTQNSRITTRRIQMRFDYCSTQRFVLAHSDELLSAFLELEATLL